MESKASKVFDRCEWEQFDLATGKSIKKGTQSLTVSSSRLTGPGVNNSLISRLKKGETVELTFPELNLKSVFKPVKSAW